MQTQRLPLAPVTVEPQQLCMAWGWNKPPQSLLDVAREALALKQTRVGDAIAKMGLLSAERLSLLLKTKPADVKTLDFLAQKEPAIRPHIDRILALKTQYAFYESFQYLDTHTVMQSSDVYRHCKKLNAIVKQLEGRSAVVVFTSYEQMSRYASAGREERHHDPIRRALGVDPAKSILVALGKPEVVLAELNSRDLDKHELDTELADSTKVFDGSLATEPHQRALADLLDYAILKNATDIAIVPRQDSGGCENQMRVNTVLVSAVPGRFDAEIYRNAITFLGSGEASGANPTGLSMRTPLDGRFRYRSANCEAEVRVNFLPQNLKGETSSHIPVSIRIFKPTVKHITFESLNIDPKVAAEITHAAEHATGAIVFGGGTNCGKSTLQAAAFHANAKKFGATKKRIMLDQPVERQLPNVIHIDVPEFIKLKDGTSVDGFSAYFRGTLRHDPDVIGVQEMRDAAGIETFVKAATSGHLVLASCHASTPFMAYLKLSAALPIERRIELIEALLLIVIQDLVQEVCTNPQCRIVEAPTAEELDSFERYCRYKGITNASVPATVVHANTRGCAECMGGYKGVLPVNSLLPVTEDVKEHMMAMLQGENRRQQINGAQTCHQFDATMELIKAHRVELKEALR